MSRHAKGRLPRLQNGVAPMLLSEKMANSDIVFRYRGHAFIALVADLLLLKRDSFGFPRETRILRHSD